MRLLRRFAHNCNSTEKSPGWDYHHTNLGPCIASSFIGTAGRPATTSADFKTMVDPVSEIAAGHTTLSSLASGAEAPVATKSTSGEGEDSNRGPACGSGRGGAKPCPPSVS